MSTRRHIGNRYSGTYGSVDELDELFRLVDGHTFYGEFSLYTNVNMMCDVILAQPGLRPQLAEKLASYKTLTMKGITEAIGNKRGGGRTPY